MLNRDKPECQLINGSVSARSLWAEKMAANNNPIRCSAHTLFHNWEPIEGDARRDAYNRGMQVRFDGYVEISPGKWVLRDQKPSKKKSDD